MAGTAVPVAERPGYEEPDRRAGGTSFIACGENSSSSGLQSTVLSSPRIRTVTDESSLGSASLRSAALQGGVLFLGEDSGLSWTLSQAEGETGATTLSPHRELSLDNPRLWARTPTPSLGQWRE